MRLNMFGRCLALVALVSVVVGDWNKDLDIPVAVQTITSSKTRFGNLVKSFATTTRCNDLAPGMGRMKRGLDAASLDLFPQGISDGGYKSPIFGYTCNEAKKVRVGKKLYDMPDQIQAAESIPGGIKNSKVEIYKSLDQVINSMKFSVGIGDALGLFMLSPSLKLAHSTLVNTSRYIEEVTAHVSAYRADLAPEWVLELHPYVKSYIDKRLAASYNANPASYHSFVNRYGTHYFKDASFGGILRLSIQTESTYYEYKNEVGVGIEAQGVFGEIVKLKGGVEVGHATVDGKFKSMSKESMRYYGGDLNLLDREQGLKDWMPTVAGNPWLFRGNVAPIHDLIKDAGKKEGMKLAVKVHLDKAYLTNLESMIRTSIARNGANGDTTKWLNMVTTQMKKPIPDHNSLRQMGKDIEYHLFVPDWFKENVRICFMWEPEGSFLSNPNQCSYNGRGGLPRKLCSKLGEFTREYIDETDLSPGGCRYSWSIEIQGKPKEKIPSWFSDTKICHKWHANGRDAGQCNRGRRDGTNCAKLGSPTAKYMDDTDWRNGGCEYSWMLQTRSDAPLWLKNLKLCFKWRPTGDARQCGASGVPRELCTKSNVWTRAYNDDSSVLPGGCALSWGFKH